MPLITKQMIQAGDAISRAMVDVSIQIAFNSGEEFGKWLESTEHENKDLIAQYASDEITTVEAIYIAMFRASNKQVS